MFSAASAYSSNPLTDVDGKKKYIFSINDGHNKKDLFLRVITSSKNVNKFEKAIDLYTSIINDAREDFAQNLAKENKELKNKLPAKEEREKMLEARKERARKKFGDNFDKEDNFTYFIVEDDQKNPVYVASLAFNSEYFAQGIINDLSKNMLFLHGMIIDKSFRGKNIVSAALDQIFAAIFEIKPQFLDCQIIIPVASMEVVNEDGSIEEFLGHKDLYVKYLNNFCNQDKVFLQQRVRDGWDGCYEKSSGEKFLASSLNPSQLSEKMSIARKENINSGEDKSVGVYIIGSLDKEKSIEILREEIGARMHEKVKQGKFFVNKELSAEWLDDLEKPRVDPKLSEVDCVANFSEEKSRS